MTHRSDEAGTDSPAIRLLDALRAGDDHGVLAVCTDRTTVSAENMSWSCTGRDEIETMLREARERFPGLTFESRTRHVGFGLVIDEARVREVSGDGPAPREAGEGGQPTADEPVPQALGKHGKTPEAAGEPSAHPMYDEPATQRRNALSLWRDRSEDGPPAPLNMPVRVAVRHDDLQVHEVTLSFPAALLKRALGMRVDPLEISLSEVQSAFIAPVGAGFTTHELARPELTLVPPAPLEEPTAEVGLDEAPPRRRRRRVLVPVLVALVAIVAAGAWWVVQGRPTSGAAAGPGTATSPQPSPSASLASPSASATASSSEAPTVTQGKASAKPTGKPNVTLRSDLAFGFNSATLSPQAKAAIAQVARQVREAGLTGKIYVDGYTDDLGSSAYGQVLSQRRADAVSAYLQSHLLGAPVAIVSAGHGESDPVADNSTAAGRQANRRVTITLPPPS